MKIRLIILLLLTGFTSVTNYAATWYVTESGAGSMNGTSWANAFPGTSLQLVINNANGGDEVWVACGTYRTTTGTDRTVAFSMRNDISLYGGFQGTETTLAQRDLSCGPCSILSGEIGVSGNADNSYQVVRNTGLGPTAVIDGFTIRDANDSRTATLTEGLGGGILNIGSVGGNCSPTIRNCHITSNAAYFGGGIFNDGYSGGNASPVISHCIITGNTAYGGGGGIDNFGLSGNASPTITNCIIYNNTAGEAAGGMYCWGGGGGNSSPTIINCVIANNQVTAGFGGGMVADRANGLGGTGGGSGNSNPTLVNTILWGNTATGNGPQFFLFENATVTAVFSAVDTNGQHSFTISGLGTGNIFTDPLFINASDGDGTDNCWRTADDGLQLQDLSPAMDAGDSTLGNPITDLLGNDRIQGNNIDMGAYEYDPVSAGVENNAMVWVYTYPNPVINELFIHADKEITMVLYNALGESVKNILLQPGAGIIHVGDLSPGIYYLCVPGNGFVQKLIKQ